VSAVAHLPEPKPKKKSAREAEAGDGYVIVEQCGIALRIPVGDNMPAAVVDAYIEGGELASWKAIRAWVGDEQWEKLHAAKMTKRDVLELDEKLGELSGN
jgi:hypothetical protein